MTRTGRTLIAVTLAVPFVGLWAAPVSAWCGTPQAESWCPTTTTTQPATTTTVLIPPATTTTTEVREVPAVVVPTPPATTAPVGDSLLPGAEERDARGIELPHTL